MSALAEEIAKGNQIGLPWAETDMTAVGDSVAGDITHVEFRQAFNPETRQPAVWEKSGEPVMEVVIAVTNTGQFRPNLEGGDNGDRAFHIRWAFENKAAFIEAMNAANVPEPVVGGKFAGQLVDLKDNGRARKPTKLFRYEYVAPPSNLATAVAEPAPAPALDTSASLLGGGGAPAAATAPRVPAPRSADPWAAVPPPTTAPPQDAFTPTDTTPTPASADPWGGASTSVTHSRGGLPTPGSGGPNPIAANVETAQALAQAAQAPPLPAGMAAATPAAALDPLEMLAQIKALIAMGLDDAAIISATGANPLALTALRSMPPA